MPEVTFSLERALASHETRRQVERFVRRRVPASEVDDLVQTVLVDALAAASPPDEEAAFKRWLMGVARHKVADHHRRKKRQPTTAELGEHIEGERPPLDARDLSRWAERQTDGSDDDARTLEWMAREGAGEKLAHIAEDEALPATMVRQRVSRLRRFMRARWKEELAAVAIVTGIVLWWQLRRDPEPQAVVPIPDMVDPELLREERAARLRQRALVDCAAERWDACEEGLDAAASLDAASDGRTDVQQAREAIGRARAPQPPPSATAVPTEKDAPLPKAPSPVESKPIQPKKAAPTKSDLAPKKAAPTKNDSVPKKEPSLDDAPPKSTFDGSKESAEPSKPATPPIDSKRQPSKRKK